MSFHSFHFFHFFSNHSSGLPTSDVSVLLCIVEGSKLRRSLVQASVRGEDRAATLTLVAVVVVRFSCSLKVR